MLWACKVLNSFPEPGKPVWEQDPKVLEALMYAENRLMEELKDEHK